MWELHSLRTHQISNLAFIPRPMDGGFLMLLHWGGSSSESGASGSELVLQCGTGMWPCVSLPQLVPKHPPTHTQLTPGMLAHSRHKLLADFSHIVTRWFVNYWECNRSASLIPTTHLLHYPCGRFFFFYSLCPESCAPSQSVVYRKTWRSQTHLFLQNPVGSSGNLSQNGLCKTSCDPGKPLWRRTLKYKRVLQNSYGRAKGLILRTPPPLLF